MSAIDKKLELKRKQDEAAEANYLLGTPIEELIDDGLVFDGETEKDKLVNSFDFINTRNIFKRYVQTMTGDETATLIRYLKLCVKRTE